MHPIRLRILSLSFSLVVFSFLTGCASGGPTYIPSVTPTAAVLLPGQTLQFTASEVVGTVSDPVWYVNQVAGGSPATGTITSSGLYTAPGSSPSTPVQVTVRDSRYKTVSTAAQVSIFQPDHPPSGVVLNSANPLVALYSFNAPMGATVQIQFGMSTNYGLQTWALPAPNNGGIVEILVAGMRASSTYHMQAIVQLPNGNTVLDTDHVFTTGAIPANVLPNLTVLQTPGMTPAPGVELLNLFEEASQTQLTAVVTDLAGNVIWYYPAQPSGPFPMKLLPNGHMLIVLSGTTVLEVDLAGNILFQLPQADLLQGLMATGLPVSAQSGLNVNHDIVKLPNGHYILIVGFYQTVTSLPGVTSVAGNALVDWDPQQGPVWTWSTFDHLSLTRAPYGASDWTHANAVLYSPDDGNLILSLRNQNWILKINYQNGAGDGKILWRLGPGGDFTLPNGQAPIEWNYGQHYPVLLGPNSAGIFPLLFFNNGNNRLVDTNNDVCGTSTFIPCYSSVPIFQLNEYTNSVQVLEETNLSPSYSICCGSTNILSNGDLEYDVAADATGPSGSYIQEVTREQTPQLIWQMNITGQLAYRGFRIPSLYPGVEWTQSAIAAANSSATAQSARKPEKQ